MSTPIYIRTNESDSGINEAKVQEFIDNAIFPIRAEIAPIKADLASATATSAGSVGGTLVRRDASKDFEASKLKLWHIESAGPVLNIGNDNQTQTLNIGNAAGVQTINVGNSGTGATTIKLGGINDVVDLGGVVNAEGVKFMTNHTSSVTLGRTAGADIGTAAAITAIGAEALKISPATSSGHTAIGYRAGANISGTSHQNTMIGREAAATGNNT